MKYKFSKGFREYKINILVTCRGVSHGFGRTCWARNRKHALKIARIFFEVEKEYIKEKIEKVEYRVRLYWKGNHENS